MLTDDAIVEQLRQSNHEFRELEVSHHRLDLELNELQKRHVLTPAEELEKKTDPKGKVGKKRQARRVSSPTTRTRIAARHALERGR